MSKRDVLLVEEDFRGFDIGEFPFDREHSAMGEYHLYPLKGNCGIWYDPVTNYNYRGPSWIITEDEGKHFMEQMRVDTENPHKMFPMLMAGEIQWKDYTVKTKLRMLNTKGSAGIGICALNSLNMLALVFESNHLRLIHRHKEEEYVLKEVEFSYDCDTFYEVEAICHGEEIHCFVDGNLIFAVKDPLVARGGKVAITATRPTQFAWVKVEVSNETFKEIEHCKEMKKQEREKRQLQYPKMKLWKKINLQNFGCGRQIRFGHLTGTEDWHIVFAQCQKRVHKDAYATISCLTAMDLDGNILWQRGEPSEEEGFGMLSADVPLQVYDIDHDGIDEVITAKNFEILILDGRTGEVKKRAKTPISDEEDETLIGVPFNRYAFDRLNPDGIRIANFSGNKYPSDILLKDRYCRVYALNKDLELMWKFRNEKNTGHFPYSFDIDGDGRDELFCGYNLIDHDGKLIWTLPISEDHTDEIVVGRFMPESNEAYFALASGTEGFILADFKGNIIKKDRIGHAQRVSVGNFISEKSGFEFCVTNFWGHQCIIYLYDCYGNPIWEMENGLNGNILAPVNWTGDGRDLILLNAHEEKGGLIDGDGVQVVAFPEDGHPTLCVEAIDLMGDARDELVVWDMKEMYIYTQEDNPKDNVHTPVKYPHYNASNYRGEYSFPDEKYLK